MKCHIVLLTLAVLTGITMFFFLNSKRTKDKCPVFEVSWLFATSRDQIVTNRMGQVVQPVLEDYHLGGEKVDIEKMERASRYEDLQMIASDRVEYMLADIRRTRLCSQFLSENGHYDTSAVSNAFASIHYTVLQGNPIPITKVIVSANQKELANAVMAFWAKAYCNIATESEQWRVDVALKNINCQIVRLRDKGLPTDDKEKELNEVKRRAESQVVRTYSLSGGD